ncbi:MAG: YdcF family protein [Actinomycetota bacterium]|nr:YdcF family protein [Actinomycetota bacterium]
MPAPPGAQPAVDVAAPPAEQVGVEVIAPGELAPDEEVAPEQAGAEQGGAEAVGSRRRSRWRTVRRTAAAVAGVLALYYLVTLWLVYRTGNTDQARPVDAIVVMGAAQYDGRPSPLLASRLDHVVELWQQGLAPLIITTGANQPGDRFTEAEASADYLVDRGVPADAIVQVGGGTSYGSLSEARDALRTRGLQSVLLVSDPYHSLRIRMISQELGLTAYVSPTRTSPEHGGTVFWREVKEAAGISVARIIGFDRLLQITG